jgi:hypothetical protein
MQEKKSQRTTRTTTWGDVLFQLHHPRHVLRGGAERQDGGTAGTSDTSGDNSRHNGTKGPCGFTPERTAKSRSVSSGPSYKQLVSEKMFNVIVTVVQQTMAESNGAVLEGAKILAITKIHRDIGFSDIVHRPDFS